MKTNLCVFALGALGLALLGGLSGCGTTVGNGLTGPVNVSFKPYSGSPRGVITAMSSISNLTLCLKRLRFKTTDADAGGNIDLALGAVSLSPGGTSLTSVSIPSATYTRVEFDVDHSCPSGNSVQLTNANGTFTSTDGFTIRFQGVFTVKGATQNLALDIGAIVSALDSVTSSKDIKDKSESANGDF